MEYIHRRSVNLKNLDLDREVAANIVTIHQVDQSMVTRGPWPSAGRMLFSSEETDSC